MTSWLIYERVGLFNQYLKNFISAKHCTSSYLITAASLICLFPPKTMLAKSTSASKSGELVWFVNQGTCCQFVSVVWLRESLGPDATSKLSLAEEDEEKKHADFDFLGCHLSVLKLPSGPSASWRPNGGRLERTPWTATVPLKHQAAVARSC